MSPNLHIETHSHDPHHTTEWVTVPGRDEPGKIIRRGKNLGNPPDHVYCHLLHFESTGEVCAYDVNKCTPYNSDTAANS